MKQFTTTFTFPLGSFVRLKASSQQVSPQIIRGRWSLAQREMRGQIIERMAVESQAGVSNEYTIRWTVSDGSILTELMVHDEIELVASEPFPGGEEEPKQ